MLQTKFLFAIKQAKGFLRNAVVLLLLMSSLNATNSFASDGTSFSKSSIPEYMEIALEKLEANHVNRARLDWKKVKQDAKSKAEMMSSYSETYPVIKQVLADLGESHSFLVEPPPATRANTATTQSAALSPLRRATIPPVLALKSGSIGYVRIPTFALSDSISENEFAQEIRSALVSLEKSKICGWIIDLRQNEGGNMFPALLALGPLVGEGKLGGLRDARTSQFWHYKNEQIFISDKEKLPEFASEYYDSLPKEQIVTGVRKIQSFETHVESISNFNKPIAVLIGQSTSSAGEAIAVVLQGNQSAKTFGRPTAGRTTGNIGVNLDDGAILVITVGTFEDKKNVVFKNGLRPTEMVEAEAPFSLKLDETETTFIRARKWIRSKQGCSSIAD